MRTGLDGMWGFRRAVMLLAAGAATQSVSFDGRSADINPLSASFIHALRTDTPPRIDGRLDDDAWRKAPPGPVLRQYLPQRDGPFSQATDVRVLFDDHALYLGIQCIDDAPQSIVARTMHRDGDIEADDYIAIALETFHGRRQGYLFLVNPRGARKDALIGADLTANYDWNGIWTARCQRDAEGWTAEIAIPFKTLHFDGASTVWGLNIERYIARASEYGRWQGARPDIPIYDLSVAGELRGLSGLSQGVGIEIVPYALGRLRTQREGSETQTSSDFGGDIRYRMTPNAAASFSYNMDFADTEADDRVVNFTRFPLFFPEKRAFFLEDSDIFAFSGHKSIMPFYSRRLGLSQAGETVPLLGAGKITGRVGPYRFGLLGVRLDTQADTERQDAWVARVTGDLSDRSTLGVIGTAGDPDSDADNRLFGSDYRYRTSAFLGDRILEFRVFGLVTDDGVSSNTLGHAHGASIGYPNDLLALNAAFYEVSDDFDPAMGFVYRKGVRTYAGSAQWGPRPASLDRVRQLQFRGANETVTDLGNHLQSATYTARPLHVVFESADVLYLEYRRMLDIPSEDFEIADGVTVEAGRHAWNVVEAGFTFAGKRKVGGNARATVGEYYDGKREEYAGGVDLRPGARVALQANYAYNIVRLSRETVETHVIGARLRVNVSPDCSWANLVQYDSISDSVGANSRFDWEFSPGRRLALVLGLNSGGEDRSRFTVSDTETVAKLSMSFRL